MPPTETQQGHLWQSDLYEHIHESEETHMQMEITRRNIRAFADSLTEGVELHTIRNDYVPARSGLRMVVRDPGVSSIRCETLNEVDPRIEEGASYWLTFPTRVKDVDLLERDRIRYAIDRLTPEGERYLIEYEVSR